jgi:hypothetical protein
MRIPAVLKTVHVTIAVDGHLAIDIDGDSYPAAPESVRGDLQDILDEITTKLGTPVKVEVREHDGTTYSDLAMPAAPLETTPRPRAAPVAAVNAQSAAPGGLSGTRFHPGEEVAVAFVVCTQAAGADGQAAMRLPPALLAKSGLRMLLVGLTSAVVAEVGTGAEPT